jgi:hypothetical protein
MKEKRTINKNLGSNKLFQLSTEVSKQSSFGPPTLSKSGLTNKHGVTLSSPFSGNRKLSSFLEQKLKTNIEQVKTKKLNLLLVSQQTLGSKYSNMQQLYHETKVINDLIYNEPMHSVSVFKDYLIMDDVNEFLKRPYAHSEQRQRLAKLCDFYNQFSEVFPNYIGLIPTPASHLFKNIQRKQRMIDEREQLLQKRAGKVESPVGEKMFSSQFMHSIERTPMGAAKALES